MSHENGNYWNTLGVARYRVADYRGASEALERCMELSGNTEWSTGMFLAMARWGLGEKDDARAWFAKATDAAQSQDVEDPEWLRLRKEAEEMFGGTQDDGDSRESGPDR